jgi:ABC-2 type transport system permease protein
MNQLSVFIRKEFYHVFRDRRTLLIMFGLPVAQILLFGFALSSEVKNLRIVISDHAKDVSSRQIINKIKASSYFITEEKTIGDQEIESTLKKGNIKCVVIIPAGFSRDLQRSHEARIQFIVDGTDPNTAKALVNYLNAIIGSYQQEISPPAELPYTILPETRMLYNETGNGSLNFIPGVLALVLMIICTALTSVAVVREKELGTMEILLVSPFRPVMVLIAKAIPYLMLSLADFILILLLSVYVLNVPVSGSIILLFLESMLFILACLSFGLFISTVTESQQAALLLSMMGLMIPTIVFTGFIFPLENMPWVFQAISNIVPSRWYYLIVKSVMLKGLGFTYVWKETMILAGMTVLLLGISLRNFKKRLA